MLQRLRGRSGRETEASGLAAENARLRAENGELRGTVVELRATIAQQQARIDGLELVVSQLQGKLSISSRKSSKPPSSDGPEVPPGPAKKKPRGRKVGAQPGHAGSTRAPVPIEQVDVVKDLRPLACEACGMLLMGEDPSPVRRQIIDIPPPKVIVTEYRLHRLSCLGCGCTTQAEAPAGLPESTFGVGVHALAALLVGRFRQSKRLVAALFEVVYGLRVSPGSVCAMEKRVAAALDGPVAQARATLRTAAVVGKDETGWRLLKTKAWLWVTATDHLAIFTIARGRGSQVVKDLLGESFDGVVCCDRWSAYVHLATRQLCWAHLLRDFTAMVERFGSPWHGKRLADCAREVMAAYAERQAGHIDHEAMVRRLEPVRERTRRLLNWAAANAPGWQARSKAGEILKHEPYLWTFLTDMAIPVTNNHCERLLRYAVIWRKLSYGCDSEAGARFVERILSVCASLQLQRRDIFAYLTESIDAHFHGQPAQSILPLSSEG